MFISAALDLQELLWAVLDTIGIPMYTYIHNIRKRMVMVVVVVVVATITVPLGEAEFPSFFFFNCGGAFAKNGEPPLCIN